MDRQLAAQVADRVGNRLTESIVRQFTVRPASEVRAAQGAYGEIEAEEVDGVEVAVESRNGSGGSGVDLEVELLDRWRRGT